MKTRIALLALLPLSNLSFAAPPQDEPPTPKPGVVELFVLDEDGEGIFEATARVVLTEDENAKRRDEPSAVLGFLAETAWTDPDGFAVLSVPPGQRRTIRIETSADARPATVEIEPFEPGETREVEVTLITKPDLDVRARVVDAETREPLEGVAVHLSSRGDQQYGRGTATLDVRGAPDAVTGPDGTFALRVRSWRNSTVTMVAPSRSPLLGILAPSGVPRRFDQPFEMRPAGELRGVVEQLEGDLPDGLTVVVEARGWSLAQDDQRNVGAFEDAVFAATVDALGRYRLDDLPSDVPLFLRVDRGREVVLREATERTLAGGEVTRLDLVLGAGRRVHGAVLEADGSPAEGTEVWLRRPRGRVGGLMLSYPQPDERTRTGADGRYVFDDVQRGSWQVGIAPDMVKLFRMPEPERYAPTGWVVEVTTADVVANFVLHRGLYIEGTIETPTGEPFVEGGASVSAVSNGMWVGSIKVKDGAFRAGPLIPGIWSLSARCWGRTPVDRTFAPAKDVVVETGGDPVVLRFEPGCSLTVHAVDPATGETAEASYSVFGTGVDSFQSTIGTRPSAELHNMVPDRYAVVMRTPDGRFGFRVFELAAGDRLEGQEIELGPGASVEVRCESPSGNVQAELYVDGVRIGFTSMPSGEKQTLYGPVGEARIAFTDGNGPGAVDDARRVIRDVELVGGSVVRVEAKIE